MLNLIVKFLTFIKTKLFAFRHRHYFTRGGDVRLRIVFIIVFSLSFLSLFSVGFLKDSDLLGFQAVRIEVSGLIEKIKNRKSVKEIELSEIIRGEDILAAMNEMHPASGGQELKEVESLKNIIETAKARKIIIPVAKPLKRVFNVQKGDNMSFILERAALSKTESYKIINALKREYDPKDMRVGQRMMIDVERGLLENGKRGSVFKGLYIQKNQLDFVKIVKSDAGEYEVKSLRRKFETKTGFADALIDDIAPSLYLALRKQNVPIGIITQMIRAYSWDVDFQRDIHPGNKIRVFYEHAVLENGDFVSGKGKLLYAVLKNHRGEFPIYRYKQSSGRIDYFNKSGASVRKALLSTPVDGARISSGYGRRKHPVSGYTKMHKGIDFAAARGTPVYAAGDGVIERSEWFSSFGKYVRIRHNSGLKTAYAHLNGFGKGIKRGKRVEQGQIIGYIGTTGRSTGPHLHYEVHKNGRQISPNSLKLPTGEKLAGADLGSFMQAKAVLDQKIRRLAADPAQIALLKTKK